MITTYHAKYYAHDLTRKGSAGLDRLSISLFDAAVDLNPHQIEAAMFALLTRSRPWPDRIREKRLQVHRKAD